MTQPIPPMKHRTLIRSLSPVVVALSLAGSLAACAHGPKQNAALDEARSRFQAANTNPDVARSVPKELEQAQSALRAAESAQQSGAKPAVVDHLAYVARQRTQVAVETARAQSVEQQVSDAGRERERMQLQQQAAQSREAADAAQARNRDLARQLRELKSKQTDRGMVLTLGDVLFDTGRATLKSGAMGPLARLGTFMRDNPGRQVAIEGHTDSTGNADANQSLSERRAQSVAEALQSHYGVDPSRITTRGMGSSMPVASNSNAAGRQQNRRVEIIISNDDRPVPQGTR